MDSIIAFFHSDTVKSILTVFLTAITTYLITKYSVNRPHKRSIKYDQFHKVYLPLYKLFCVRDTKTVDSQIVDAAESILYNNYELVFPQLHSLIISLQKKIKFGEEYADLIESIVYQVSLEYELLKKDLGYPSISKLKIFRRMKTMDKIKVLSTDIPIILIIFFLIVYTFVLIIFRSSMVYLAVVGPVIAFFLAYWMTLRLLKKKYDFTSVEEPKEQKQKTVAPSKGE